MAIKCQEGAIEVKKIHSNDPTNYAVWTVEKKGKRNILKFQESGPGGLAEVRAALDPSKLQYFLYRVTGIDERAGAKSIRSKFVRGSFVGSEIGGLQRAKAGILQTNVYAFLKDAAKSYQISSIDEMTEEIVEADLRAAAGAHQVQRFDFANLEARVGTKKNFSSSPKPAAKAAPAPVADAEEEEEEEEAVTEAAPPKPASSSDIKLTYFGGPGRAEAIRLIFAAGEVNFEDERLTFEEWGKVKGDPDSVPNGLFGALPILTHGDFKLGQSRAIQTYAAAIALPSTRTTPKAVAIDSMFQNAHADVQTELYKCLFGSDESKEAAKAKINESLVKPLTGIEKNLPDSGFIKGGDIPSAADIVVFDLGSSSFPSLKDVGVDLSNYPKFNALVAKVGAYPPIAKYVASK